MTSYGTGQRPSGNAQHMPKSCGLAHARGAESLLCHCGPTVLGGPALRASSALRLAIPRSLGTDASPRPGGERDAGASRKIER